ncbi:MAG: hypothetical protein AB4426_16225 [Xenococcaceae cyanobacterium]
MGQSEKKFRQLAENMHQIVWMYSHDRQPLYISSAFEKIWGQPCDRRDYSDGAIPLSYFSAILLQIVFFPITIADYRSSLRRSGAETAVKLN